MADVLSRSDFLPRYRELVAAHAEPASIAEEFGISEKQLRSKVSQLRATAKAAAAKLAASHELDEEATAELVARAQAKIPSVGRAGSSLLEELGVSLSEDE